MSPSSEPTHTPIVGGFMSESQWAARQASRRREQLRHQRMHPSGRGRSRRSAGHPAPKRRTQARRSTRTTGGAGSSRGSPREPSDEPLPAVTPPQTCSVCGATIHGRRSNAVTCKGACRQKAYRERKKAREFQEPSLALRKRYDAALEILRSLSRDERLDLLAAVVWPSDARLREAA